MRWTQRVIPGVLHHFLPIAKLLEPPVTWLGVAPLGVGMVRTSKGFGASRRAGTPVVPFAGSAWIHSSSGAFVSLPLLVWILHSSFLRAEERPLEEIFGGEYLRYKSAVRRSLCAFYTFLYTRNHK